MEAIEIDTSIFPLVMSASVGEKGRLDTLSIDLPRGANVLYLHNMNNPIEIDILRKYANKEKFSDEHYESIFKFFINNTPRLNMPQYTLQDMITQFGVCEKEINGKYQFKLIPEYINQIKVDTWECITLDLLRDSYTDIINCFDFGDINIYLGSWQSEFNVQKQSLLTALRSALIFTLVGFIFGDDRNLYSNFNDFFENEFYKRVVLINAIWRQRKDEKQINYIPIFDSFYNLEGNSPTELIQIIHSILSDENIVKDERMMIKNRLIDEAKNFHSKTDTQRIALEQAVVKPVVNYLIEIQSANENISAAEMLKDIREASINRSYYAMMHALKALLENKQQLSDWEPGKLNVNESHNALEKKLISLYSQGIIARNFVSEFQYVKQKRWIADYNISTFSDAECLACINKAKDFTEEVKRISLL